MPDYRIPFNRATLAGNEHAYIQRAVADGHISGDGAFTKLCHEFLERQTGCLKALLTTSCTHALELSALLLDIGPGDEVIIPSFTFVSTVNAFVLRGARPIFVDIRPNTLNIDESQLEQRLTPRTRAIVVVHYAGVGCEMDAVGALARHRGIPVVEDNAHGLFGKYKGKQLGSFGTLATQSFHETKNVTCGEGGALLINDPALIERAEILREKGTDRSRFFRGQVDKYTWVDVGSSYVPSEILAAFLYAQLEARDAIQERRKAVWEHYFESLRDWACARGIRLPFVPEYCDQPYHMFYMIMPSLEQRTAFIEHMRSAGILSVFHYAPLHLSAMGRRFGGQAGDCPVTEHVSNCLVRLPLFAGLDEIDYCTVVSAVREF